MIMPSPAQYHAGDTLSDIGLPAHITNIDDAYVTGLYDGEQNILREINALYLPHKTCDRFDVCNIGEELVEYLNSKEIDTFE